MLNPLLENFDKDFDEKFPCIQSSCDNNGTLSEHGCNGIEEDCANTCPIPAQCQYCYEQRLPLKSLAHSHLEEAFNLGSQSNLERLIEKLGDKFEKLEKITEGKWFWVGKDFWHVSIKGTGITGSDGSTPTEAVENLIKALEKPKKEDNGGVIVCKEDDALLY